MKLRIASLVAACLGALLTSARADVIVVDPHGGPGAALLLSALDAAKPGDIVLLRDGEYLSAGVISVSKGLTLIADTGLSIELPSLDFRQPEGQLIFLRGLRLEGSHQELPWGTPPALNVLAWGPLSPNVWIEDCEMEGTQGWVSPSGHGFSGGMGLSASRLGALVVERSRVSAGAGADAATDAGGEVTPATPGGEGMSLDVCTFVVLDDVSVTGGRGGDGTDFVHLANGGAAVVVFPGVTLALQGCRLRGGDEGDANPAVTEPGSGLFLFETAAASIRDSAIVAGAVHGDGTAVPDIELYGGGPPVAYPDPARVLAIDSPVREFGHCRLHVEGEPGDFAFMFLSTAPGGLPMPSHQGLFSLDPLLPVSPMTLGLVDATGVLDVDRVMPALPSGFDAAIFFAQLAVGHDGALLLGTASSIVWISAAY